MIWGFIDGTAKKPSKKKSDELTSRIKQLDNLIRSFEVITQNVFDQREAEIMSLIFRSPLRLQCLKLNKTRKWSLI